LNHFKEEASHHEFARLVFGDASALEVKDVLFVEAAGRRGVSRSLDVAGLDLEVRDRIGAGALGQCQVTVLLVGIRSLRHSADQHITNPYGMGTLPLQRSLISDAATGAGSIVVDVDLMFEVLAGVRKVRAVSLTVRALRVEVNRRIHANNLAAKRHHNMLEARIPP